MAIRTGGIGRSERGSIIDQCSGDWIEQSTADLIGREVIDGLITGVGEG